MRESYLDNKRRELGATILEFSLVGTIFIFMLLSIFELSRVLAVRAALVKGTQDAAVLASQLQEFSIDPRTFQTDCAALKRYDDARRRVAAEAVRFPLSFFIQGSAATPAMQKLVSYQYSLSGSPCSSPSPTPTLSFPYSEDALILRPYDDNRNSIMRFNAVPVTSPSPSVTPVIYPGTFNFAPFPTPPLTTYRTVLGSYPICVEMGASVKLLFNFFAPINLFARSCSFQESAGQSNSSLFNGPNIPVSPTPSPTASGSPPATATPTATGTPSAVPTASSTATGSRSPSPTPVASGSASPTATATRSASPSPVSPCVLIPNAAACDAWCIQQGAIGLVSYNPRSCMCACQWS